MEGVLEGHQFYALEQYVPCISKSQGLLCESVLGPYGITANVACPANVNTEMPQRAFAARAELTGTTAESIIERHGLA